MKYYQPQTIELKIQNAKRLLEKQYYLAKTNFEVLFSDLYNQETLIVYQMGRVGSTTIFTSLKQSLKSLGLKRPIYHTHFLTPEGIAFMEKLQESTYGSWDKIPPARKRYILQSYFLNQQIQKSNSQEKRKYKFITLVREPIATNVSGFFHNCDLWLSDLQNYDKNDCAYLKEIAERFWQKYPHDVPLNWFDRELKNVLGIDVFASEFPIARGYKIYEGESFQLLLLRLESLSDCVREAFKKFLNIDNFTLVKAHEAKEKKYFTVYQSFLNSISMPEFYLKQMYDSRYSRHFYTRAELEVFTEKWRNKNEI